MPKIKINDENVSMKNIVLEQSQFDIPKQFTVDFSRAHAGYKYADGERTEEIDKYIIQAVDKELADKAEKIGLDTATLKEISIEITGNLSEIQGYIDSKKFGAVELVKPVVKLRWGGRSWQGVKLLADGVKMISK